MPDRYLQIALAFTLLLIPAKAAGSPDSLLSLLDSSLVSRQQVELRLQIARELSNLDIAEALQHARKALQLAEQLESPSLLAEVKLSIGKYYDYLGVQEEAIASLSEALEVFDVLEDSLKQLFDPFFTTKDPGKGTGLELSISYTLVSEHSGSIKAENRENGVSFIIEIPA